MLETYQIGSRPVVEYFMSDGISMMTIPYDLTEVSPGIFSWTDITIKQIDCDYGGIVNALISLKYSPSAMTAIINNYLLDPEDDAEFLEMQDYRKLAKEKAKQILVDNNF